MLSTKSFIKLSLELNLFFMRIMKEHSLFILASLTPRDKDLAQQVSIIMRQCSDLLCEAVMLSDGNISPEVAHSGEIVTDFTYKAERATVFYTGIPINSSITEMELSMTRREYNRQHSTLENQVAMLNQRSIAVIQNLIAFKSNLLQAVLSCKTFTTNYPLLIDHIRREAILYVSMLTKLQSRRDFDMTREAVEQESFWNRIMAEHAKFIRGLLDPTEEQLIEKANDFGKEFDVLTKEALALNEQIYSLPKVTEESLKATKDIRDFKRQATEGLNNCKIRSIILPLLGDHVLREANHFVRLLKDFKEIR